MAVPSSTTAGAKAKTIASRNCENLAIALPATAVTFRSGRSRSFQSRNLTNAMPMFWPRPAKLAPEMTMHDSIASFCSISR